MTAETREGPPAWLLPLLGNDDLVVSPAPVSTVRHAAAQPPAAEGDPLPGGSGAAAVHFAVVDRHDPNRVLTFHAVTASSAELGPPRWWSFVNDRWAEDPGQAHTERGPLRWVPGSKTKLVIDQLLAVQGTRSSGPTAPAPESLHARLTRALQEQSTGHDDLGAAYLQWAGYPQGLLLEVGDSAGAGPLEASWAERLGWLGWQAPDVQNQNAWFQAELPNAVELAVDLLVRTREVIVRAATAQREDPITELGPEDLGWEPTDPGVAGGVEHVARDLDELLEILGYYDAAALQDALFNAFDDPDARLDVTGGQVRVVAHAGIGVTVDFPTTASAFWELIQEHYTEVDKRD